jgi:prolyl-tRNA editing enzyme YbaK/EbsC (Cys-tRNA(Pro) deacylase)
MSKSIDRVSQAAAHAGLDIEIRRMGESTRTAVEAAEQCGCSVGQIVKSLIFRGEPSGRLYLFLVPGNRQLDTAKAEALVMEKLLRADPRQVREETGFAIGGVSPLGHAQHVPTFADAALLAHPIVWAAAGAHDAVFSSEPQALVVAARAQIVDIAS